MLTESRYPLSPISDPASGARVTQLMKNAVRTQKVRITVSANYQVTVVGTKIRNRGSILAALGLIGLDENGIERVSADARMLGHLSRAYAVGRETAVRLTEAQAKAVGTYALSESFDLNFATGYQAQPGETSFVEADTRQALQMFYNIVANAAALSDATAVVKDMSITAIQVTDNKRATDPPLFIPNLREAANQSVAAANDSLDIYLRASRYLRGLLIMQETDNGEVTDIIDSLTIGGDDDFIIGPKKADFAQLVADQYRDHPGMTSDAPAHLFVPLMRHGRLSTVLNPAAYRNLRITAKVAPSADGANSRIRVVLVELRRAAGLTAAQLPFVA